MAQVDNTVETKVFNSTEIDMALSNKTESYKIMKNVNLKSNVKGGPKCLINYEEIRNDDDTSIHTRKRSDSIKLYKKHKRDRERKNSLRNNNNSNNEMSSENENDNKFSQKSSKNVRSKKVTFLEPNFITIIDVESYKKYNEENTCKDPFEDIEFINNMEIEHIYTNNNEIDDGKERVHCSCSIF